MSKNIYSRNAKPPEFTGAGGDLPLYREQVERYMHVTSTPKHKIAMELLINCPVSIQDLVQASCDTKRLTVETWHSHVPGEYLVEWCRLQ